MKTRIACTEKEARKLREEKGGHIVREEDPDCRPDELRWWWYSHNHTSAEIFADLPSIPSFIINP